MGYDQRVTIERADNGYTVEMRDPKVVAANRNREMSSKAVPGEWQDPQRTYVFTDMDGLTKFLKNNLDKALAGADYDSAFDLMAEDDED